jgi:hypothetical protein
LFSPLGKIEICPGIQGMPVRQALSPAGQGWPIHREELVEVSLEVPHLPSQLPGQRWKSALLITIPSSSIHRF